MQSSRNNKLKNESTSIRFGSRAPLVLSVRLNADAGVAGPGMIALDLPLHTNLVVTLSLPGEKTPASRSLAACVVRIDPAGVGIEWRDMAGADVLDLLERAAHRQAAD